LFDAAVSLNFRKREIYMKIAFTTSGNSLDAPLDSRFGRAPKFLVYDLENGAFEIVDNEQNLNAAQGAGIQSAETVARLGVKAVVTGHCGPKAFRVLSKAGIRILTCEAPTVGKALEQYFAGLLMESKSADVEEHWA
jgi:predicted Fe-Mo cluster-binding NifX family protein